MERADSFEAHTGSLRNWFGVMARPYVGVRILNELRGWPCINLETVADTKRLGGRALHRRQRRGDRRIRNATDRLAHELSGRRKAGDPTFRCP